MKRRDFIQRTALVGSGIIAAGTIAGCTNPAGLKTRSEGGEINNYPTFELDELTIADLQSMMQSGKLTSRNIVDLYLKRIQEIDKKGPGLNSILQLNPDAVSIAENLDKERVQGKIRGKLHGIPILLKGNIDTADKMFTNAGATALANSVAQNDAFLVEKLRDAGAVILGKTNLSEWANFRSTRSSSGWSSVLGQTRNPYLLDRSPCGSSSGSGVAVSANLCPVAVGTETDGSIVCPSSINGIVGIKPTVGLVSRSGIIPISQTCDTAGPMARTVTDAAILLTALTGKDEADFAMTNLPVSQDNQDYTRFLDAKGLNGARIGIARSFFNFHEKVDKVMEDAIGIMKENGAIFIELADYKISDEVNKAQWLVLLYEFKAGVNSYLSTLPADYPIKSLNDIIGFNKKNELTAMPFFGQEILEMADAKGGLDENEYLESLELMKRMAGPEGIDKVMNENNLDAIIAPTGSPAWTIDLINGDHFIGGSSSPAAMSGYPAITVPAGFVHGLPVGISFFGKAFSEPTLIKIAYAFEQATTMRRKPEFISSLDMSLKPTG
jgi:amidase